jgi:hypothetical protein
MACSSQVFIGAICAVMAGCEVGAWWRGWLDSC